MSHLFKVRRKGTKKFTDLFAVNKHQAAMNMERIKHSRQFLVKSPRIEQVSLNKTRKIARGRI